MNSFDLFVCLFKLMPYVPVNSNGHVRDVASILVVDFYPTLGWHSTQNVLHIYNYPTKPIRLICMNGLTKTVLKKSMLLFFENSRLFLFVQWHANIYIIMKTCPCKVYPLKPHFYMVKLGYAGVCLFFLFLLQNIDCGYSLEPPRRGGSNVTSTPGHVLTTSLLRPKKIRT